MQQPTQQLYRCTRCDNVSWKKETCHGQPMKPVCFCGSGKILEDCHSTRSTSQTTQ